MELNQIVLGDAIDYLKSLPDGSVDALISDPPYNTTALKWDQKVDWQAFWAEAHRVCKPSSTIALFAQQPFATDLIVSNRTSFRYEIVWEKSLAVGFLDCNFRPMRCHELILIFCQKWRGRANTNLATYNPQKTEGNPYKRQRKGDRADHYRTCRGGSTLNTGDRYPRDVLKFRNVHRNHDKDALHPTQKPLDLIKWLVLTYSNPSDIVLDPFMGSGTTAVACIETDRNFIGTEREPSYHKICLERIEKAYASKAEAN